MKLSDFVLDVQVSWVEILFGWKDLNWKRGFVEVFQVISDFDGSSTSHQTLMSQNVAQGIEIIYHKKIF